MASGGGPQGRALARLLFNRLGSTRHPGPFLHPFTRTARSTRWSSSRCASLPACAPGRCLQLRMGRSAKVSRMGMPAFEKNKKMSSNAAKPQSVQASGSAIKKAAPKKKVEKKKAQFKGDNFQGKPSKKA